MTPTFRISMADVFNAVDQPNAEFFSYACDIEGVVFLAASVFLYLVSFVSIIKVVVQPFKLIF